MNRDQINRIISANTSSRYKRLEALESWIDGSQYDGRPDWWTGGPSEAPLWERAPCVVYPVVGMAIDSNVDLCLGGERFPKFKIGESKPNKDDADPVASFLVQLHSRMQFSTACREALAAAQGCGTAVAIYGVRDGLPTVEMPPAKWCAPEFKRGALVKLTIQYPYEDERELGNGKVEPVVKLYKREITETSDTVFIPKIANESGVTGEWQVDDELSVKHGLGFCPVVWFAFQKGCQPVNVIDGRAIHERITDEIQAHDIARSQWHRGALYSEPQICEIGVSPGYNPTSLGREAGIPGTEHGGPVTPFNPITTTFGADGKKAARKKGPGQVWQYSDPAVKVQVLEYSASALKSQQDNCSDLRLKIQEALSVVFLDPENIKFAATTSGKALDAIRAKQLDRCAKYRDDFRDGFLVPSLKIQLKLAKGAKLTIDGTREAVTLIGDDVDKVRVETVFGSFFRKDVAEEKAAIELLAKAVECRFLDQETAIERAAALFSVEDVEALKQRIADEMIAKVEREVAELKRWSEKQENDPGAVPGDSEEL